MSVNPLFLLLPPVAFAALWSLVCFIVVLASGWRRMAVLFAATHIPHGQKFGMQQALVNSARFNGSLSVVVGPEGLYMKIWPLFSVFGLAAGPLLIPWHELTPLRHRGRGFFESWTTSAPDGKLSRVEITFFNKATVRAISQFLPTEGGGPRVGL